MRGTAVPIVTKVSRVAKVRGIVEEQLAKFLILRLYNMYRFDNNVRVASTHDTRSHGI